MDEPDLDDFFSARARAHTQAGRLHAARQSLESLLRSRALRSCHFSRRREIGPYLVDYVCSQHSLILELHSGAQGADASRTAFLRGLGYTVLEIPAGELAQRPGRVLKRIRKSMEGSG
jgi:very-short-patch-repair endonuclease